MLIETFPRTPWEYLEIFLCITSQKKNGKIPVIFPESYITASICWLTSRSCSRSACAGTTCCVTRSNEWSRRLSCGRKFTRVFKRSLYVSKCSNFRPVSARCNKYVSKGLHRCLLLNFWEFKCIGHCAPRCSKAELKSTRSFWYLRNAQEVYTAQKLEQLEVFQFWRISKSLKLGCGLLYRSIRIPISTHPINKPNARDERIRKTCLCEQHSHNLNELHGLEVCWFVSVRIYYQNLRNTWGPRWGHGNHNEFLSYASKHS